MNKICITGNVGKFIVAKMTQAGKPFISFSFAGKNVNKKTGEIFVNWHNVKCSKNEILNLIDTIGIESGDFAKVEGSLSYFKSYDGQTKPAIWIYNYKVLKKKNTPENNPA